MEWVRFKTPLMPYSFVKKKGILPLEERNGKVIVAVSNPLDLEAVEEIQLFLGKETVEVLALKSQIEEAIEKSYHQDQEAASDLIASLQNEEDVLDVVEGEEYDLFDSKAESP